MSGNWLERATLYIESATRSLPEDTTLVDRRKFLRSIGSHFHEGTFWGRRQWGKAVREYLERHGQAPREPRDVESAPNFGPDIIFPYRGKP